VTGVHELWLKNGRNKPKGEKCLSGITTGSGCMAEISNMLIEQFESTIGIPIYVDLINMLRLQRHTSNEAFSFTKIFYRIIDESEYLKKI